MTIRPMLRLSALLLLLAAGFQFQTFAASSQGQGRSEGGQEKRENRPERREDRPERREVKQDRREDHPEKREDRPERREQRGEPPRHVAPQPMPGPRPYAPPRGMPQDRPMPRLVPPSDPGSTGRLREGHYAPPSRSREQARSWESRHGWRTEGAWAAHSTWQEHRAHAWEQDHRTWANRGGYGGYFIPEPQFRLHFGPERWFRIRTRPMIHLGYPRFHYGNYWFLVVDPWPEFWSENWYATDDVYIGYNDGYYLYNRRHPGIAIAVSVSL